MLLLEGAWTAESNCMRSQWGHIMSKPRLFVTKGLAVNYLHKHFRGRPEVTARVYHGATKAWERDEDREARLLDESAQALIAHEQGLDITDEGEPEC